MRKDQELFEDQEKSLKNVRSGRSWTSPDDMDKSFVDDSFPDEDIIDLVDVVREGQLRGDMDSDNLSLVSDQERPPQTWEDVLGREDLDEFSLSLDETSQGDLKTDLTEPEAFHPDLEPADFDFETLENLDEAAVEPVTEISDQDLEEIPEEDMDLVMAGLDEGPEETSTPDATPDEIPGISQERLEAVITQTVTDVVERVVRETMADVAERVIREAIDSLKLSLDAQPK